MEQNLAAEEILLPNRNQLMKNLQNLVLKLAQAHPNAPLPPPAETLIRDRLHGFVSLYTTPDHPPYSAMIENALRELNEKSGSSKRSISRYLEKRYDSLPWAHSVLLKHHIQKSCESGEIVVTRSKKYRLAGSLNLSTKVKSKPRRRKWRWECERQKHHQLKIRLIRKRNEHGGKKVEKVIKKQQECDEKEQPLTENGERGEYNQDQTKYLLSCVDGEKSTNRNPTILHNEPADQIAAVDEKKYSEEVRSQQQNGLFTVAKADIAAAHTPEHQEREQSEHDEPELSTPERPPGFESVRVENIYQLGSTEPDAVEVSQSAINGAELVRNGIHDWRRDNKPEKSETIGVIVSEKSKLPALLQNEQPCMTIDSSILSLTRNESEVALSTEQEPKELVQGKQLCRSLRARRAKPQPEACPVTFCRQQGTSLKKRARSWPPPKPMKATSKDELQDSPKSQKQRMLQKQKPDAAAVNNLEQDFKKSGKPAECTSMHENIEVLLPDNSKPHLQKRQNEQRLERPPERRSARLLKRRFSS